MNDDTIKANHVIYSAAAGLISLLLIVNGVFIKRSLDKIDELEKSVYSLAQAVAVLNAMNETRHH